MTKTAVGFDNVLGVLDAPERVNSKSAKWPGRIASFGLENQEIIVKTVDYPLLSEVQRLDCNLVSILLICFIL